MSKIMPIIAPGDVLTFWFTQTDPKNWFEKSDAFDAEIRERFGATFDAAMQGALDGWTQTAEGALALVIVLDQFSRNIHRGSPAAFSADAKALGIAKQAIASGFDAAIPRDRRNFFYLPFQHSEVLADQERGMQLYGANDVADGLRYMTSHRDIIARFGRFPHRNAVLGRASTPEELDFLQQPGSSF